MINTISASNAAALFIVPGDLIEVAFINSDEVRLCVCISLKKEVNYRRMTVMGNLNPTNREQYVSVFKVR